jgi:hypothetical protein
MNTFPNLFIHAKYRDQQEGTKALGHKLTVSQTDPNQFAFLPNRSLPSSMPGRGVLVSLFATSEGGGNGRAGAERYRVPCATAFRR